MITVYDGQTARGFEGDSVELDAFPPHVLRDMVREVIEQHITPRALRVLRTAEASEREQLQIFASAWGRS